MRQFPKPFAPKPTTLVKPSVVKPTAPAPAKKPVAKMSDPSEAVADDKWGGGHASGHASGQAEVHIDLDDKNFGKY